MTLNELRQQERTLRASRAHAVDSIRRAQRTVRFVRVCAAVALAMWLAGVVLFGINPSWFNAVALTVGTFGTLLLAPMVGVCGRDMAENRACLASIQREYDDAVLRLDAEEYGRPVSELLDEPPVPLPAGKPRIKLKVRTPRSKVRAHRDAEYQRMCDEADENFRAMEPALRPATPDDYRKWLAAFLAHGPGNVQINYVDRPMPKSRWYVATRPLTIRPLYGASAINIIVPRDVKVNVPYKSTGATGHSTLHRPDGSTLGFHNRPEYVIDIFTDTPEPNDRDCRSWTSGIHSGIVTDCECGLHVGQVRR